jgi:hypothetical protein
MPVLANGVGEAPATTIVAPPGLVTGGAGTSPAGGGGMAEAPVVAGRAPFTAPALLCMAAPVPVLTVVPLGIAAPVAVVPVLPPGTAAPVAVLTLAPLGAGAPVDVVTLAPLGMAAPVPVVTLPPLGTAAPVPVLTVAAFGATAPALGLVVVRAPAAPFGAGPGAALPFAVLGAGRRTGVIGGGVGGTRVGVGGEAGTLAAGWTPVDAGAAVRAVGCAAAAAGAPGDTLASAPGACSAWQTDQPWPPQPVCSHHVHVPSPATGPLTIVTRLPGGIVATTGCSRPGAARTFRFSSATTVASVPASWPGGTAPAGPTHNSPSARAITAGARVNQRRAALGTFSYCCICLTCLASRRA